MMCITLFINIISRNTIKRTVPLMVFLDGAILGCTQNYRNYLLNFFNSLTSKYLSSYWRWMVEPLAWWVARMSTSAICTCLGAEAA